MDMLRGQSPDEPSRWGGKRREDRIGEREEKRERKEKDERKKGRNRRRCRERKRERGSVESGSEREEEEMKLKSGRRTPLSGRVQHVI